MALRKGPTDLLGNSAVNAIAFAVAVALNLLILPFVVFRLGVAAFGTASLIIACVAPALAFSNTLALSTTRELALRLGPSERIEAQRHFATSMMLAMAVGGSVVAILALAGPPLARLAFHLNASSGDLDLAFGMAACGWLCQCVAGIFLALFTARQNYRVIAAISISGVLVATGSMLLLIPIWPKASTFLGCQTLGFATNLVLAFALSRRTVADWLARPALHRGAFGNLVRLGSWQLAAQAGAVIAAQADRYLLGALLQPQFVGFYSIAQRLEEAVYIGVLKVGEVLFPFFSTLQAEADDRKFDLLLRSSWVLNVVAASAIGGLIPVAGPLLQVWTGAEVGAEGERVLVILSIAGILGSNANVFVFYLLAQGQSRSNAVIALMTGVATVTVSAVVLPVFGWQGAGWSACIGMIAQMVTTLFLLRTSFSRTGRSSRLTHFVLVPLGVGIVTALALRYGLRETWFDHAPTWWRVGSIYVLASGIIFVVAVGASWIGPHGTTCRRDLHMIASRFLPVKAS